MNTPRKEVDREILKQALTRAERLRKLREEIEEQRRKLKDAASAAMGSAKIGGVAMEAAQLQALTTDLTAEVVAAALDHSTDAANQSHQDVIRWQKFAVGLTVLIIGTMVATSPWCAPPSTIVVPVESPSDSPPDTPLPVTRLESSTR